MTITVRRKSSTMASNAISMDGGPCVFLSHLLLLSLLALSTGNFRAVLLPRHSTSDFRTLASFSSTSWQGTPERCSAMSAWRLALFLRPDTATSVSGLFDQQASGGSTTLAGYLLCLLYSKDLSLHNQDLEEGARLGYRPLAKTQKGILKQTV